MLELDIYNTPYNLIFKVEHCVLKLLPSSD